MYKLILAFFCYLTFVLIVTAHKTKELNSQDGKIVVSTTSIKEVTISNSLHYAHNPLYFFSNYG